MSWIWMKGCRCPDRSLQSRSWCSAEEQVVKTGFHDASRHADQEALPPGIAPDLAAEAASNAKADAETMHGVAPVMIDSPMLPPERAGLKAADVPESSTI